MNECSYARGGAAGGIDDSGMPLNPEPADVSRSRGGRLGLRVAPHGYAVCSVSAEQADAEPAPKEN